jgi:hypothetical protein
MDEVEVELCERVVLSVTEGLFERRKPIFGCTHGGRITESVVHFVTPAS